MKKFLYLLLLVPLQVSEAHASNCTSDIIPALGCQTQVRPSGNATTGYDQLNGTLNLFWDKLINIVFIAMGIIAIVIWLLLACSTLVLPETQMWQKRPSSKLLMSC